MQVLRNLIDEKLQIQEARSNVITIPEAEVEQTFARVAQNFKREPKDFAEFLKASGSSDTELKQQLRSELAWSRLPRRSVEPFLHDCDDVVSGIIERSKT